MGTQKKTKKKHTKSKRTVGNRVTPTKRLTGKKRGSPKKKSAKKKPTLKEAAKTKAAGKKKINRKRVSVRAKQVRDKSQSVENVVLPPEGRRARSGGQSGDLQGLSDVERADSESVDELLEEGNALEADVVKGVEDAESADEREVHTHEVPEDDVPDEYLDKE